jgi:chemotaxis protein methyltransferase CheR
MTPPSRQAKAPSAGTAGEAGVREAPLAEVARVLAEVAGVSLADGLGATLRAGLDSAAEASGTTGGDLAHRIVAGDPAALVALVEHAALGETAFWRHPEQLEGLARLVGGAAGPLRIWCAGCATGEEPYSVAIALLEAGRLGKGDRIVATDVSGRALAAARAGLYGARALRKLPAHLVERWFGPGERRPVAAPARALVTFARHNLVADPAPEGAPFDLVLCRNVLIYFTPRTARSVLARIAGALVPGGILALGPVELPLASALGLERAVVDAIATTLLRRPR